MISKIVRNLIKEKVKKKEMFTSLDVANEIKNSGVWISNKEVSIQLKELFASNYTRYTTSVIKVTRTEDSQEVDATLYHNKNSDINDYSNKNGKAISPNDFDGDKSISLDKNKDNSVKKENIIVNKQKEGNERYRIFNFVK